MISLVGLQKQTIDALLMACTDMDNQGIKYCVTGAFRSTEYQQALFVQGRNPLDIVNAARAKANLPPIGNSDNSYTVTKCDGVTKKSNHQSGLAVDIVPVSPGGVAIWPAPGDNRWTPIITAMKKAGFQSGSEWKSFPDWPHYEIRPSS